MQPLSARVFCTSAHSKIDALLCAQIDIAPAWGSNRLESCYFDFNNLVARDPNALTITDSFFLSAQIVLSAVQGHASDSRIFANQYSSWIIGQVTAPLRSIVLNGSFAEPSNFRVVRGAGLGLHRRLR